MDASKKTKQNVVSLHKNTGTRFKSTMGFVELAKFIRFLNLFTLRSFYINLLIHVCFSKVSLTMLRKSLETVLLESFLKLQLRKLEKPLQSKRSFRTNDTKTENCRSLKCSITQIVLKCGNRSIPTEISLKKFILMLLWTTFLIQPTAL